MVECLDWNGFRYLLAVARTGQLTGAARTLGVDAATVSRRLSQLESAVGARLFDRSPAGYALNATGRQMLATAERIEGTILRLPSVLGDNGIAAQTIRIGAPPGFGDYFLAPRIAALCDEHPSLNPEILVAGTPHSLAKREVDLSITTERPTEGRLYVRKLCDFSIGLYGSASYLEARRPLTEVADLAAHDVLGEVGTASSANGWTAAALPEVSPRFRSTSLAGMINAALGGAGLCLLPDFVARQHLGLRPVLSDQITSFRTLWLVVHADMRSDPKVKQTSSFIQMRVRTERHVLMCRVQTAFGGETGSSDLAYGNAAPPNVGMAL